MTELVFLLWEPRPDPVNIIEIEVPCFSFDKEKSKNFLETVWRPQRCHRCVLAKQRIAHVYLHLSPRYYHISPPQQTFFKRQKRIFHAQISKTISLLPLIVRTELVFWEGWRCWSLDVS